MPRAPRVTKTRQNNASVARAAHRKASVEDIPDDSDMQSPPVHAPGQSAPVSVDHDGWDLNPDMELPHDEGLFLETPAGDPEMDLGISSAAELDAFTRFLSDALKAAQAATAKRQKESGRKERRGPYKGNSDTTKWRAKQLREQLAAKGFHDPFAFMRKKQELAQKEVLGQVAGSGMDCGPGHKEETAGMSGSAAETEIPTQLSVDCSISFSESSNAAGASPQIKSLPPLFAIPAEKQFALEPVNVKHVRLKEMLEALGSDNIPDDPSPETAADRALKILNYRDFPKLQRAAERLELESKDKNYDFVFRGRILAMLGTLRLYLDPLVSLSWRKASTVIAKSQGCGSHLARRIRDWLHVFLAKRELPKHNIGEYDSSLLDDEDFELKVKLHVQGIAAKDGHFRAQDVADFVASVDVQAELESKGIPIQEHTISVRTARRWLKRLDFRFGVRKNGLYIDGHEREDVVAYRNAFVKRWMDEYEPRMVTYDANGVPLYPRGFALGGAQAGRPFRLYLVTHDESTFYANDRRKTMWVHDSFKNTPLPKGEGVSIMVSDFLTPDWGRLKHDGMYVLSMEARILFRAGKNRDGYFASEDLLATADNAIDIFEAKTNGMATGLFMFDNAPSHQKRAADALSARKMPKNPHATWGQNPRMRPGLLPDGVTHQSFYFSEDHPTMPGWFKGMEQIIRERGQWPAAGLNAECTGFKCVPGSTGCCCRRTLFCAPDFVAQKSALQELVESRGHICDFYPKYHCELNFIEMYWGAAKLLYRKSPRTSGIDEMEANVIRSLDLIPQSSILRFANRSARFISAYAGGLTGAHLGYLKNKYRGHRVLPQGTLQEIKEALGIV
ncbi:hypothetical protein MKEN_01404000 [Mycena kentingensis (nom. inval.)]|nr:hypothetical protein MKEN_01404000 [Mycena kentingensis (nom. inval.)]